MRIYYFGELVEDTSITNKNKQTETKVEQTSLALEKPQKTVFEQVDELLQDIDMNLDRCLPFSFGRGKAQQS